MTSSNTPSYPEYKFVPTTVVANGETLAKQYQDAAGNIVTDIIWDGEKSKIPFGRVWISKI